MDQDTLWEIQEAIRILAKMVLKERLRSGDVFEPHPAALSGRVFYNSLLDDALAEAKREIARGD